MYRERVGMRSVKDRVLGHTHPRVQGGRRMRCREKQGRAFSGNKGEFRKGVGTVANALRLKQGRVSVSIQFLTGKFGTLLRAIAVGWAAAGL